MNDLDTLEHELGPALRSTFDACLGDEHATDQPGDPIEPVARGTAAPVVARPRPRTRIRRRRATLAAAVAAVVGLGVAGVIAIADRAAAPTTPASPASEPSTGPVPPSSAPDGSIAVTETTSAPTDGAADASLDLDIALPSAVPDGYVLDDIDVTREWSPFADRPIPDRTRYLRRVGGEVDAVVTLSSRPLDDQFDTTEGSITVHGNPARISDSGSDIRVEWAENDRTVVVATVGVSWDDTAALAEQSSIDPATGTATLPAGTGFELTELPPAPAAEAAGMSLSYSAGDDAGQQIGISRLPNAGQDTLELTALRLTAQNWSIADTTVGGLPALVMTPPATGGTPPTNVQWTDGDGLWTVSGQLDNDTLIEIANSLQPATLDDARQLRADLDTEIAILPELDRTTLSNGIEISIHTTGNGVAAFCTHQPEPRCDQVVSESSLIGEQQTAFTRTIWLDDQAWMIGWAEGQHEPTRYTETGSTDPVTDTIDGALVQADADGTFIAVPLGPDEFQFSFDPDSFPVFSSGTAGDSDPDLLH